MSWNDRWMDLAQLVSTWSKDASRKTGAVIVDDRNVLVAVGWNGFPRGVDDDKAERHERPAKYWWTEHAERNAIYDAAAKGISTRDCKIIISWYPCADCARAIIQAGIGIVIAVEPDWDDPKWSADFAVVKQMFAEAGIFSLFLENRAAPRAA